MTTPYDIWVSTNPVERESAPAPECVCGHDIKEHEDMGDWYARCQVEGCLCSEFIEFEWDDEECYDQEDDDV